MIKERVSASSEWTRIPKYESDRRQIIPAARFGDNPLETLTTRGRCFEIAMSYPLIYSGEPIELYLNDNPEDVVVGVGSVAMRAASIPNSWNDGIPTGWQNESRNDADFVILTENNFSSWLGKIDDAISMSEEQDSGRFNDQWTRLSHKWSKSIWGIEDYVSTRYSLFPGRPSYTEPALDIHHLQVNEKTNTVADLLHLYNPFYHTGLGLPLLVVTKENAALDQQIIYPFRPKPRTNEVKLAVPERFTETDRSILMVPRFALFTLHSEAITRRPVTISDSTFGILKDAVDMHAHNLSEVKKASAGRRLATCLHRAKNLARDIDRHEERFFEILDQVGWREALLLTI